MVCLRARDIGKNNGDGKRTERVLPLCKLALDHLTKEAVSDQQNKDCEEE